MIDIIFDCETTGLNPYTSEIIEAFFIAYEREKVIDSYHLKARVRDWSEEAAEIHKIDKREAMMYPSKNEAYTRFLSWLPSDFRFITYANKNTMLGTINFDVAILLNELDLLNYGFYYLKNNFKMKDPLSAHTMAKRIIKGEIKKYSQENVYYYLFKEKYNAHDAKSDTYALARIYYKLLELEHEKNNFILG